jgi:hypothetical protein
LKIDNNDQPTGISIKSDMQSILARYRYSKFSVMGIG